MNHPKHEPISEAEHWWNHLTFAQREFATKYFQERSVLAEVQSTLVAWCYERKETLHQQDGWPETPMRSI